MAWTAKDEDEFLAWVEKRSKGPCPFNPLGRGHKPPTVEEVALSLPIKVRIRHALERAIMVKPEFQEAGSPDQSQASDQMPDSADEPGRR